MFHYFRPLRQRTIRFTSDPADVGVLAEPVPAKSIMPEWFKKLPVNDKNHVSTSDAGLTIKRCIPFLDAMTAGWIIPLAATVRLEVKDGGGHVDAGWDIDRVMVSFHGGHQVAGHPTVQAFRASLMRSRTRMCRLFRQSLRPPCKPLRPADGLTP